MWRIILFLSNLLITCSNGAELYCTFDLQNSCNIIRIENVTSADDTISVIGQPPTYVDSRSTIIYLDNRTQIDYFPRKLFDIFPNAISITTNRAVIRNIVTNTFGSCGSLKTIYINTLGIRNLPSGFAENCKQATRLSIGDSGLVTLQPDALRGLTSLKNLHFFASVTSCIPPGFFSAVPQIQTIEIDGSRITAIDTAIIKDLPNLTLFSLQYNHLTNIPNIQLPNLLSASFSMNLNSSPISAIDPKFLAAFFGSLSQANKTLSLSPTTDSQNNPVGCITEQINFASDSWRTSESMLANCYSNWTIDMENQVVPCAPTTTTRTIITTTTTTSTTTELPTTTSSPTTIPFIPETTVITTVTAAPPESPTVIPCALPTVPPMSNCDYSRFYPSRVLELILNVVRNVSITFN